MELSIQARLCFIGLWTFADDNGVHPASPKTLKAEVFPADDLTADVVSGLIAEMVSHGLVGEFEADGKRYWFVTGWHRHQRIDRPTFKHPSPPTGKLDEQSANTRRVIDEHSTSNRPRKGKERRGEEKDLVGDASPTPDKQSRGTRLPQDWQPDDNLKTWASKERPELDLDATLEQFRDYWVAIPGAKGIKLDWNSTFRNWVRNQRSNGVVTGKTASPDHFLGAI
jgi:hypothetical protein